MTNDEKWKFIEYALKDFCRLSDKFDATHRPIMLAPESPLLEPMWNIQSLLVKTLEKLCEDDMDNITWYVFECDFGRDKRKAGCKEDMRVIDSVDRLRWLCETECE